MPPHRRLLQNSAIFQLAVWLQVLQVEPLEQPRKLLRRGARPGAGLRRHRWRRVLLLLVELELLLRLLQLRPQLRILRLVPRPLFVGAPHLRPRLLRLSLRLGLLQLRPQALQLVLVPRYLLLRRPRPLP